MNTAVTCARIIFYKSTVTNISIGWSFEIVTDLIQKQINVDM